MSFDLFICSSEVEKDKRLRGDLGIHLSTLRNRGMINDLFVDEIVAKDQGEATIFQHLEKADIIILLITPDFTYSSFCKQITQLALARHKQKAIPVIPVLLRPTDYEEAEFAKLEMLPQEAKAVTIWRDPDDAFVNIIEGIKRVLGTRSSGTSSNDNEPQNPLRQRQEHVSNLPFLQNPYFTGREKVLARLRDTFIKGNHIQLLSGKSAIGKTQTALAYAYQYNEDYQYSEDYQYLLWVGADSQVRLASDFVKLAQVLDLPEKSEQDQINVIAAVKRWLQTHDKWLLILDDADLEIIEHLLPHDVKGHILLTARAPRQGGDIPEQPLEEMDEDEGALLLLHRAKLLPLEKKGLEILPDDVQNKAREITRTLEGRPLALELAGAYIAGTGCSPDNYITYYRELGMRYQKGLDQPDPIDTAWLLSFKMIEDLFPGAADLLRLYAFLHPDTIPEEMITNEQEGLPTDLQTMIKDEQTFDLAIERLRKYSLVRPNKENSMCVIHRRAQRILKESMDEAKRREWAERAIRVVSHSLSFEPTEAARWERFERMLPQVLTCRFLIKEWHFVLPDVLYLLNNIGLYLMCRGRYEEAKQFLEEALTIRRQIPGMQRLDIARNLDCLATLYKKLGMFEKAKQYYQEAQILYEYWLPLISVHLVSVIVNQAEIFREEERLTDAIVFFQRALDICDKTLGSVHPLTQETLSNIERLRKQISPEGEGK